MAVPYPLGDFVSLLLGEGVEHFLLGDLLERHHQAEHVVQHFEGDGVVVFGHG